MPLTETQPDALAEVYATSLFELAEAAGGQSAAEESLGELEDILEMTRTDLVFSEFLASRVVPVKDREKSLRSIFEGRVSDLTLRFLLLLNRKGRLSHLPPVVAAFDTIVQDRFGRTEIDVYTATPLAGDELESIRAKLREVLGGEAVIHPYTDPAMLGGVKLQIGDRLIDASLASRLAKMREQLKSGGSAELRARFNQIVDEAGS